jgi:CDP-diacylglycerol--glycerol-3-phosphate 3-phosphatidyltransferase
MPPLLPRRQLPNALTLLRLFLAAAFFAALNGYRYEPPTHQGWANLAAGLFIAAAVTDALDGYFARKWDATSTFGRIMDPFCDKVLVLGAFLYLAGPRFVYQKWVDDGSFFTMSTAVYPWMVAVILARELLVTSVRGVVESRGIGFGSNRAGKAKMILQSVAIPTIILLVVNFRPAENDWARVCCHVLVYVTLLATLWSAVPYVLGVRRLMTEERGAGP